MRNEDTITSMPVKETPYEHQQKAFNFICDLFGLNDGVIKSRGAALLMEMGTGKTMVCIAVIGLMYFLGLVNRVLIVAPLSVLNVWESEFKKFADFPYTLTILTGSSAKKSKQLAELPKTGLQIIANNYDSVWRLQDEMLAFDADLVIADEAHKIKNSRTKQSRAMHSIGDKARYRLALTGTPIPNKELDIFSQYRFLNSDIYGLNFYRFRDHYFYMGGYENHTPIFLQSKTDEFQERLYSIAFRATKAECLDLPEITEEIRTVELEPAARKIYENIRKECYAELGDGEVTATNILTKLLRLSQITGGHLTDDSGNVKTVSEAKLNALSDIIDSCSAEDKKLVVMVRFLPELEDIQKMLEKKKLEYATVCGSTKNRDEEVSRFQSDPNCRVFLGQIATAGLGISLTAASTMVFYSLDYNMSNFDQAKARIHRSGQTENCQYIYLIAKDTIDKSVLNALRRKQNLAETLIDDFRNGHNPF